MNAARVLMVLAFLKPLLIACTTVLTFSVGVYALTRRQTTALSLLSVACFVTTFYDAVYFIGSIQTHWKITLFPLEVRLILSLFAELVFIIQVILWPLALFLLIRERPASEPIHLTNRSS